VPDAATGEEIWAHPYPSELWDQAHRGGTLSTPSIDGDVVYTLNREGNLFCFEAATGAVLWHRQLAEELEVELPTWGFSASPLVLEGELVINAGKILSLSKKTGELRWASRDYGHAYCTPAAFELAGKPALAVLNGNGVGVVGRADGKELYFAERTSTGGISAATPIVIDDAVFVSSNRIGGGTLLAFGEDGLEVVWESRAMTTQMSGCVLMGEHLFGFDQSVLKCIDVYGEEKWSERGIGNGAVTGTPGRLLLMSSRGELIVAEATPAEYRELSRAKLFDSGVYWTVPVLVNGLVYCRSNEGRLVCRDHRGEG
jgi:outer membrane protein assembly factor BamB